MAGGGQRVKYSDFAAYFRRVAAALLGAEKEEAKMREVFKEIDVDGDGGISKLELVAAMQNSSRCASYLLPNVNTRQVLEDETSPSEALHVIHDMCRIHSVEGLSLLQRAKCI